MSRVLKSTELSQSSAGRFAYDDWGSASAQAATAQLAAEELLAAARAEAAQIRDEAREAGLTAAMSEFDALVDEAAKLKFEAWLPVLNATVAEVTASKTAWLAAWESAVLRVSTAIAARIVRREIERTPEMALTLVRETLELATTGEATLRLNPADAALLEVQLSALLAEIGRASSVTVVADAAITRGGCRLETRLGTIDQQLEAQLARIEEELR